MSKFKVGDKVKVVNGGWGIAYEDVEKMRGEVFEVFSYLSDGYFGEEGYLLKPSLLKRFEYMPGEDGFIGEGSLELVEAAQESNETPPLVQKTTPKNDDSGEGVSQPRVDKNAWFERGELPEVGTVCEYRHNFTGNWNEGEVVAQLGSEVVICDHNWHTSHWLTLDKLRPIKKTAEEMEAELLAEEREKAVGAVEEQILEQMGELNVRNLAEHIVDTFDLRFPKGGK